MGTEDVIKRDPPLIKCHQRFKSTMTDISLFLQIQIDNFSEEWSANLCISNKEKWYHFQNSSDWNEEKKTDPINGGTWNPIFQFL